jgi:hypothetical protein
MVKFGVLFEVRTEFLNNIQTSFVFKGLSGLWQGRSHNALTEWSVNHKLKLANKSL